MSRYAAENSARGLSWGLALAGCLMLLAGSSAAAAERPPAVGDQAADFTLSALDGESVELKVLLKEGPVVLVVLRGYPGYQCPACSAQVGEFTAQAKKFASAAAKIVLVYPGAKLNLGERAQEFLRGEKLPENVYLVTDPDYSFTNNYHLRWDAEKETAYPSTFVIDPTGKIRFAQISKTHGGRVKAATALEQVSQLAK
jgi:peroxiredoxin Q/BCP